MSPATDDSGLVETEVDGRDMLSPAKPTLETDATVNSRLYDCEVASSLIFVYFCDDSTPPPTFVDDCSRVDFCFGCVATISPRFRIGPSFDDISCNLRKNKNSYLLFILVTFAKHSYLPQDRPLDVFLVQSNRNSFEM